MSEGEGQSTVLLKRSRLTHGTEITVLPFELLLGRSRVSLAYTMDRTRLSSLPRNGGTTTAAIAGSEDEAGATQRRQRGSQSLLSEYSLFARGSLVREALSNGNILGVGGGKPSDDQEGHEGDGHVGLLEEEVEEDHTDWRCR